MAVDPAVATGPNGCNLDPAEGAPAVVSARPELRAPSRKQGQQAGEGKSGEDYVIEPTFGLQLQTISPVSP